jgi:hypothetical protein
VICVFGATVEGVNPTSGGNGGGAFGGAGAVTGTSSFDARGQGGGPTVGGVGGCSTMGMGQCGQTGLPLQGGGGVSSLTTPRIGATFGGRGAVGRSTEFNAGGGGGGYFGGGGGVNETAQGGGGGSGFLAASVLSGCSRCKSLSIPFPLCFGPCRVGASK